jgi:predicted outer membrane repeat protein
MSQTFRFAAIVLAVVVAPLAVRATTIHVPGDQPTIQEGIDAAAAGDTVLVYSGPYTGVGNRDLDFGGVNIVLLSEFGSGFTTIDCEGAGRGLYFHSGEDTTSVVEGFFIRNATADSGAGAFCVNGSSPKFVDCRIRSNTATTRGGGVCCYASSPVFRECLFELNEVSGTTYPEGGAMACINGANAVVTDCQFTVNTAATFGGAVLCDNSAPQFRGCWFDRNVSASQGGGAVYSTASTPIFTGCTFTENSGGQGGAIYTQGSPITATGCDFIGNTASGSGGALSLLYGASTGQISHCTFVNNSASSGGAVNCYDNANAAFANCTFVGNDPGSHGVIHLYQASPTVENCILAFSTSGVAASCQEGTENPTFSHCVLFGNAGGDDLCGTVADTLHRDPNFCGMPGGDYRLCQDSICAETINPWGELIGALDVGCGSCGSAVAPRSWGIIKSMYR